MDRAAIPSPRVGASAVPLVLVNACLKQGYISEIAEGYLSYVPLLLGQIPQFQRQDDGASRHSVTSPAAAHFLAGRCTLRKYVHCIERLWRAPSGSVLVSMKVFCQEYLQVQIV